VSRSDTGRDGRNREGRHRDGVNYWQEAIVIVIVSLVSAVGPSPEVRDRNR